MINNLPITTIIQDNVQNDTIIEINDCLIHYPNGLRHILELTIDEYEATYWIVNNSLSMAVKDSYSKYTRFQELCNALKFHTRVAKQFNKHIQFHIVNKPDNYISKIINANLDDLDKLSQTETIGDFSLNESIHTVISKIQKKSEMIHTKNKKVHVVITADCEPIDNNFLSIINKLIKRSFIDVTVCLCTDDPKIIDYWQNINELTGDRLNILDNIYVKTNKVLYYNSWFSYCEPIHRVFECGKLINLFHLLDEQSFSISDIHNFSEYFIDKNLSNPLYNFNQFILTLNSKIHNLGMITNPINKKQGYWINIKKINRINFNKWLTIFFLIVLTFYILGFFIILNPKNS